MNYIIYDLEFNQQHSSDKENKDSNNPDLTFEIIQIGAIKVDESFNVISKFNSLVKPTVHHKLHPYVEVLTKIDMNEVNKSKTFPHVFDDFLEFIGNDSSILCIWGLGDIKELFKNIKYHNLSTELIPKRYIDVQEHASKFFKTNKSSRIGLRNAVDLLNIETNCDFHNAYYDAFYTFKVFKKIYTPDIKESIYSHSTNNNKKVVKEIIDLNGLFKQFEKIYSRKISDDEKEMIKIAYMMGKTKQFVKKL